MDTALCSDLLFESDGGRFRKNIDKNRKFYTFLLFVYFVGVHRDPWLSWHKANAKTLNETNWQYALPRWQTWTSTGRSHFVAVHGNYPRIFLSIVASEFGLQLYWHPTFPLFSFYLPPSSGSSSIAYSIYPLTMLFIESADPFTYKSSLFFN